MKSKILSYILKTLTFPFICAVGGPFLYTERKSQNPLKFNKDGKFRILHLTDVHLVHELMEEEQPIGLTKQQIADTLNLFEECIKRTNPDLVVFTGDNVSSNYELITYDYAAKTIRRIYKTIGKYNLPLAIVFGNHDGERNTHKEFQMRIFMEYENFRGVYNEEEMYGCGNYSLPILSSDGKRTAFNLWMFDSNDYLDGIKGTGYDCVHKSQLDWYRKKSDKLKAENGGKPVYSFAFQHICVPEVHDAFLEVDETTPNAIKCGNGKYYILPENATGELNESPSPPESRYDGEFDAFKSQGDVLALFCGHDHVNDFIVEKDGIKLCQTICGGFMTYGWRRGGRIIEIDEKNPKEFFTETVCIEEREEVDI